MTKDFTICIGTVGAGVWQSSNGGENWRRSRMKLPFDAEPGEIDIRALAPGCGNDAPLYAGSEAGIYVSSDKGASWEHLDSPMDGDQIWSIAVHPDNPDIVLAGTKPPVVYRSDDAGKSWAKLPIAPAEACLAGPPKVTNIVFDPRDTDTIWVGIEIDGIYRSRDGGATWEQLPPLGSHPINQDIHAVRLNPDGRAPLLAATPDGIWQSTDEGTSWQEMTRSVVDFPAPFNPRKPTISPSSI